MIWKKWQMHEHLHYRLSPKESRRKILLIPGLSSPLEVFDLLIPELESKGFQVLTFDIPGRGHSSAKNFVPSLPHLCSLTEDLLDHVGWGNSRFTVMGFSWGAGLASFLALAKTPQVELLYLISPVGLAHSFPLAGTITGIPILGQKLFLADFHRGFENPDSHREFRHKFKLQCGQKDFQAALRSTIRHSGFDFESIFKQLAGAHLKVILIAAKNDPKLKLRLIGFLEKWIPGLECKLLEKGRHMLPLDRPLDITSFLQSFLFRHDPDIP